MLSNYELGDERVAREVAARHAACALLRGCEERACGRQVAEQCATPVARTADASTDHYLVVGVGLAHGSSQTEHDALDRAVMEGDLTLSEARWMRGFDASEAPLDASEAPLAAQEQGEAARVQSEEVPPPEESPPPVFADCSHYDGRGRARARVDMK